ncbi:DUF2283 domain-containing protein [Candidatus Uhrbacteria bacterium]|nr:DUF2283 domain-containing protein [Candidatus Uhrbacteria bacterium]
MNVHYDKKVDALSIRFNSEPYVESEELEDGIIFDYDKNHKVIAIEILQASKKLPENFEKVGLQNLTGFTVSE